MLRRSLLLTLSLVSIQGCAILGIGGAYQTVDTVTTGATAISYGATGKGLSDHAASAVTGKDCRMFNVLQSKNICRVRRTYEVRNLQQTDQQQLQVETLPNIEISKEKEKLNEPKLGTRHKRHAHKVRSKRSNIKAQCKPPRGIFGFQDPFLARRTGRNETCRTNK